MSDNTWILAILILLLEARRWWGEHQILRGLKRNELLLKSTQDTAVLDAPAKPKDPAKDDSVIHLTAAHDQRILGEEDM